MRFLRLSTAFPRDCAPNGNPPRCVLRRTRPRRRRDARDASILRKRGRRAEEPRLDDVGEPRRRALALYKLQPVEPSHPTRGATTAHDRVVRLLYCGGELGGLARPRAMPRALQRRFLEGGGERNDAADESRHFCTIFALVDGVQIRFPSPSQGQLNDRRVKQPRARHLPSDGARHATFNSVEANTVSFRVWRPREFGSLEPRFIAFSRRRFARCQWRWPQRAE